jgi:tRNA G18 (ribose-2'-O)-methylase SpoU
MRQTVLIVHDIRSTHNVGALLRTAECLGANHVYFTGYTPYPATTSDDRLPHIAAKLTKQIEKTSLGTETMIAWSHEPNVVELVAQLKADGFVLVGLEQHPTSMPLNDLRTSKNIALLIGREVEGIAPELLEQCDTIVEIPQFGKKKSLNVVQATAIALYHLSTLQ